MPRLISASVDDSLYSADLLRASEVPFARLSHAVSAIELRGSRQPKFATARPRKCRGRRSLRATSSLPLNETSNSACISISKSGQSGSEGQSPSSHASDYGGSSIRSPDHGLGNGGDSYPSPPASEYDVPSTPSSESRICEDVDPSPFPLTPVPLLTFSPTLATKGKAPRTPRGRSIGTTAGYRTPTTSPDRYISNRYTPQDASKTFRLSKSPQQLSSTEKLLRHPSATPDPFGPVNVRRIREARINASANAGPRAVQSPTRTIGTTNVQHPPQDPLAVLNRQASAGAVWNVGGGSQAASSGPVRGVSDGRGGFVSSGSNAPMFTSHFFDDDNLDEDNSQLESRLAVALDIDQTRRVLDLSRSPVQTRSVSTGSVGTKRKCPYVETRTRWMNGQWVQEGSQSRESAPFLARCRSLHPAALFIQSKSYHDLLYSTLQCGPRANVMRISSTEASEERVQRGPHHTLQISPRSNAGESLSDGDPQCWMLPICGTITTALFSLTAILLVLLPSVLATESISGRKPWEFGTHQKIRILANQLMSRRWPSLPTRAATASSPSDVILGTSACGVWLIPRTLGSSLGSHVPLLVYLLSPSPLGGPQSTLAV